MKALFALAVLLAILGLDASPAVAKIMRFTQQGDTALIFHMPDDWITNIAIDTQAETLISPGNHGLVLLAVLAEDRSLDEVAAQAVNDAGGIADGPPRALAVSGKEAEAVTAQRAGHDGSLTLRLLVIRVDPHHIGLCMALVPVDATPAQRETAEAILDTIRVSPPDTSFGG